MERHDCTGFFFSKPGTPVVATYSSGKKERFDSISMFAEYLGVGLTSITKHLNGRRVEKIAKRMSELGIVDAERMRH